jgi:ABC-type methionine transport system ATPase subunit
MSDQVIRLIYPASLLSSPVINQLIRRFDITVNIVRAQVGSGQAWLDVSLAGNPTTIDEAIAWLKGLGIEVHFPKE